MSNGALSASLLALLLIQPGGDPPVQIVTHPATAVSTVSRTELSKIFLKRLRTWADGEPVRPVDQRPESEVRERFTRQVHERSVVTIEVYWKRMIFSGRAVPPEELADDDAVLEYLRRTPGAIGYVSPTVTIRGVKKLVVTK